MPKVDRSIPNDLCGAATGDYRRPIISDQRAAYTEADYAAVLGLAFLAAMASSAISAVDIWLAAHARYARQDRERRKTSHAALSYSCEMSLPV
jgi:hypothetical protein